jgi:hypothetical protein
VIGGGWACAGWRRGAQTNWRLETPPSNSKGFGSGDVRWGEREAFPSKRHCDAVRCQCFEWFAAGPESRGRPHDA